MKWLTSIWNFIKACLGAYDKFLVSHNVKINYDNDILNIALDGVTFNVKIDNKKADAIIDEIVKIAGIVRTKDITIISIPTDKIFDVVKFLIKNDLLANQKK